MCPASELCGFIEAKTPSLSLTPPNKIRNKPLSLWKNWKKYWCTVKRLLPDDGNCLELTLERVANNKPHDFLTGERRISVKIPGHSIMMRTRSKSRKYAFGISPIREKKPLVLLCTSSETESQWWMESLRALLRPRGYRFENEEVYSVSIIDNAHSRAAGLHGLYGDLVANGHGIFVRSPYTGEIRTRLEWREVGQCHLANYGRSSDVKRIIVVHTSAKFRNGVGELHLFCHQAGRLLKQLATEGRGPCNNKKDAAASFYYGKHQLCYRLLKDNDDDDSHIRREKNNLHARVKFLTGLQEEQQDNRLSRHDDTIMESNLGIKSWHRKTKENDYHQFIPASILQARCEPIYTEILEPAATSVETLYENVIGAPSSRSGNNNELLGGGGGAPPPPLPPRRRQRQQQNLLKQSEWVLNDDDDDDFDSQDRKRSRLAAVVIATTDGKLPKPPGRSCSYSAPHLKNIDDSEYVFMLSAPLSDTTQLHDILNKQNQIEKEMPYVVMR